MMRWCQWRAVLNVGRKWRNSHQACTGVTDNGKILLDNDCSTRLTCCSTINCQIKCISTSAINCINEDIKKTAYFNEFYDVVKLEAEKNDSKMLKKYKKISDSYEREKAMKRWMFLEVVDFYIEKNEKHRRRHVDFIFEALDRMKELGVERDLSCYKALVKVFPPDIMVPETRWQVEFKHFPKQQDCALEIMEHMTDNAVVPDQEFGELLADVFGMETHAFRKLRRMLYWMPKMRNLNPYQLPHELPHDPIQLALLALKKMSIDLENELKVFKIADEEGADEETFIASAQSPDQRRLLSSHSVDTPLYVEGGYKVWLRDVPQTYFVLRADSDPGLFVYPTQEEQEENLFDFETVFETENPKPLAPRPSDHQQQDGTILAMCITQTGTKASLVSWIRCLQEANPCLEQINVVFTLRSPDDDLISLEQTHSSRPDLITDS